jgi:hypothetical protein
MIAQLRFCHIRRLWWQACAVRPMRALLDGTSSSVLRTKLRWPHLPLVFRSAGRSAFLVPPPSPAAGAFERMPTPGDGDRERAGARLAPSAMSVVDARAASHRRQHGVAGRAARTNAAKRMLVGRKRHTLV